MTLSCYCCLPPVQFHTGRIVLDDGTVNPAAFYNYLTAWKSNDALAYTSAQAQLRPIPKEWYPEGIELSSKYLSQSVPPHNSYV